MPERLFAASSDEDDGRAPVTVLSVVGASQPNEVAGGISGASQANALTGGTRVRSRSRRAMLRKGERGYPQPGTVDLPAPRELDLCPHRWVACINVHCDEWRACLGRQLRKRLVVTAYTGTNASGEVLREIGVSHHDLVASDPKAAARHFREQTGLNHLACLIAAAS